MVDVLVKSNSKLIGDVYVHNNSGLCSSKKIQSIFNGKMETYNIQTSKNIG